MSLLTEIAKAVLTVIPNAAQSGSLSRWSLTGLGSSLVTTGLSSGNWPMAGIGAAILAAPAVWGLFRHTDASMALSAADIKGVTLAVNPSVAPDSVVELARKRTPDIKAGFVQTLR